MSATTDCGTDGLEGVAETIRLRLMESLGSTPTRPSADLPLSGRGDAGTTAEFRPEAHAVRMRKRVDAGIVRDADTRHGTPVTGPGIGKVGAMRGVAPRQFPDQEGRP